MHIDLLKEKIDVRYYDKNVRRYLIDNIETIRDNSSLVNIDSDVAILCEFDLRCVLAKYEIHPRYHHIILVLNDYDSFNDYHRDNLSIFIPSFDLIDRLVKNFYDLGYEKNKDGIL